jgi:hypothetical protein
MNREQKLLDEIRPMGSEGIIASWLSKADRSAAERLVRKNLIEKFTQDSRGFPVCYRVGEDS